MPKFNYLFCLLGLLFAFSLQLNSQGFLKTNGKNIVDENGDPIILKGMGLGGWMLQEGYMLQTADFANAQYQLKNKIEQLIGKADTDLFYEAWLANHVRKIDIDSLKSWGFNSVRLPMHYNLFTLPTEEEPIPGQHTWLEKGFALTDSLIAWCKANEMYVILDLHAAPGGQGNDLGISDRDPTKPSLWDSEANQRKTVALWKKLAETYVDEPWVAGYDLINETNWEMPGNIPLRDLYDEITDSIRTIDTNHILFIEGNWFANDFTGLTPPWDDNMVYSPHKYWSFNDQASIQWVLDLREEFNVPIYFGETGENSNTWFREAIQLFEKHNIGWAWWPMKKIESIAGPLSLPKTPAYQTLLDYWSNGGIAPSAAFAKTALMGMAEGLKLENCRFQKDVIDAMFRQQVSEEALPFHTQSIPGVIYATDFDMGAAGIGYSDTDIANYQVSTGNFTAWNSGWSYRNDGVDIEATQDNVNTNGYNVGWLNVGEWMQYSINVTESAVYDIKVRIASNEAGGQFHFSAGEVAISGIATVPATGGWQNWQTVTVANVVLDVTDKKLRFHVDKTGFNLNSFEFIQKAATTTIPTTFVSAITSDDRTIQLYLNKPLAAPIPSAPANFQLFANGNILVISNVVLDPENTRKISLTVDHTFRSSELIKISYNGNEINAQDGTALIPFSQQPVQNTISIVHAIPGRVQAEDYFFQSGIQLENTADAGGGQNIGFLDIGDYLDYYINVAQGGAYTVNYRTAALSESGQVQMQLINADGSSTLLHTVSFPATGGWQSWTTTPAMATLPPGQHQIRIAITKPLFNMNWFEFILLTPTKVPRLDIDLSLFPNPSAGSFLLKSTLPTKQHVRINIHNLLGQLVMTKWLRQVDFIQEILDLGTLPDGTYVVTLQLADGSAYSTKILKGR